jgi:hypothetical protein
MVPFNYKSGVKYEINIDITVDSCYEFSKTGCLKLKYRSTDGKNIGAVCC